MIFKNKIRLALLLSLSTLACAEDTLTPVAPPAPVPVSPIPKAAGAVLYVSPNSHNVLSQWLFYSAANTDTVQVFLEDTLAKSVDTLPAAPYKSAPLLFLDLKPATTYRLTLHLWNKITPAKTILPSVSFTTDTLPTELAATRLQYTVNSGSPGYTLTNLSGSTKSYIVIYDAKGRLAWYRSFPGGAKTAPAIGARQQPNGNFTVFLGATLGWQKVPGHYEEVSPSGELVRSYVAPAPLYTDNHEIILSSKEPGAAYLFGYNHRSVDQTNYDGSASATVAGHQVIKLLPDGKSKILFDSWDHFDPTILHEPPRPFPDFAHPNSLEIDRDDNLLVSFRNRGSIVKINASSGAIIWQMGGPDNQFTFINDPLGGFSAQHDVRRLPNGNILVFDNGTRHTPQITRVLEYAVDEQAKTATLVWSYSHPHAYYSPYTGSAQRLANGHTVIGFAGQNTITEVDSRGNIINQSILFRTPTNQVTFYRALHINALDRYQKP